MCPCLLLTRCCFSLGIVFFRMRSWCSWKRISFGKPGTKKPEEGSRPPGGAEQRLLWTPAGAKRGLTVHGVLVSRQQFDQSPEGVLLVHVDEQQGRDLTHPLTVAHLLQRQPGLSATTQTPGREQGRRTHRVVDGVGCEDVEERLLSAGTNNRHPPPLRGSRAPDSAASERRETHLTS